MLDGCGTMVPMCWLEILHVALDAAESFFFRVLHVSRRTRSKESLKIKKLYLIAMVEELM